MLWPDDEILFLLQLVNGIPPLLFDLILNGLPLYLELDRHQLRIKRLRLVFNPGHLLLDVLNCLDPGLLQQLQISLNLHLPGHLSSTKHRRPTRSRLHLLNLVSIDSFEPLRKSSGCSSTARWKL